MVFIYKAEKQLKLEKKKITSLVVGGEKKTPSEPPIPPAGSDILVEVWLPQKRWIGETGNHGGHRNVPSRPFSFGIRRKNRRSATRA